MSLKNNSKYMRMHVIWFFKKFPGEHARGPAQRGSGFTQALSIRTQVDLVKKYPSAFFRSFFVQLAPALGQQCMPTVIKRAIFKK